MRVIDVESGKESGGIGCVGADVGDSPSERAHRTIVEFAVRMVMNAYAFPAILLVVEFKGGACGRQ